ncbi:MAG: hypothetical protein J5747_13260 [Spirochaetaceae bacterium]|nr:hypothetical protein [Spirochaetaceae bacterium]MBO4705933.1 hypothetical protein [Spirochaetaceae bacterium]
MSSENFFQRLFEAMFKGSDPEVIKRKHLKAIAKELSKGKFKFIKGSSAEVQPAFAKMLYDFYKATAPAQLIFQNTNNPALYKQWVIEHFLTKEAKEAAEKLDEETIQNRARTESLKDVKEAVNKDFAILSSAFDMTRITNIDETYSKLVSFIAFCKFDYFFVLKKFDSSIREHDFTLQPHFEPIRGEYVADDIKDFIATSFTLPISPAEWTEIFQILKEKKDVSPISQNVWNKILARLRDLRSTNVLDGMIQLITEDPDYSSKVVIKSEHIAEAYLDNIRSVSSKTIHKLAQSQQNSKTDDLLKQIFGTTSIANLKYYTATGGTEFEKKKLGGYTYANPLNYLKAYLIDCVKKDLRVFCDLVLVRGKWVNAQLSAAMSDAYHKLLEASDSITAFDSSISESGEYGAKFKNYMLRVDRDNEARNIIQSILNDLNGKARMIIGTACQYLITIGKNIKNLLEDYEKPRPELLINWKELEHFADTPIVEQGKNIYKQIYLFVQLMQLYMQKQQ